MFGHLHAGQQINGVQVMYTNGEQLGVFAYFIREFIKVILSPISILMSLLMGKVVLAHDTIMGTDAYYVSNNDFKKEINCSQIMVGGRKDTFTSIRDHGNEIIEAKFDRFFVRTALTKNAKLHTLLEFIYIVQC